MIKAHALTKQLTKRGTFGSDHALLPHTRLGAMVMLILPASRTALIAGATLAATAFIPHAIAQEAPPQDAPAPSIDFSDSGASFGEGGISLTSRVADARFAPVNPAGATDPAPPQYIELQIAANRAQTGAPLDVAFAQRGLIGADENHQGTGSEVRVGRGLFVASDNHALAWRPGARSDLGGPASSLTLQDQVNIGDNSAGVTYEHNGVQASVAYVERSINTRVGNRGYSQDESFAGVTVTMRH